MAATRRSKGFELSYQQQLTFLPGWAKGFGLYTNYTLLKTQGNYGGAAVLTNNSLAGFLQKTGNVGLSYRGYGFDLRLQANYRGQYLRTQFADSRARAVAAVQSHVDLEIALCHRAVHERLP